MSRLFLWLVRRRLAKTKRLYDQEGLTDRVKRRAKTDANIMGYDGISKVDYPGYYEGPGPMV